MGRDEVVTGERVGLGDRTIFGEQRQGTHQPAAGLGRKGIPSRHDQAAQLAISLGRTALLQEVLDLQRALRERGQGPAQHGQGGLDIHGAAQAELRGGAHEAGRIHQKGPGDDVDVAALPLHGLSQDLAVLQGHEGRIDRDIPAGGVRPALDRCADFAVDQPDGIRGLDDNIAAARLARFRCHHATLAQKLRTSVDGDVAGIPLSRTLSRHICAAAQGDGLAGVERDVPSGIRSQMWCC